MQKPPRTTSRVLTGQVKSLDGLRCVAVTGVILYHTTWHGRPFLESGSLGVNLFFVLSGFLITTILIGEVENDRFRYAWFLARRALRLVPALTVLVLVSVPLLWLVHSVSLAPSLAALPFVLTYTSNIAMLTATPNMGWFAHTWSLSLEEQFYLIFPLILVLLLRKATKTSALRIIILAALLLAVARAGVAMNGRNGLSLQADTLLVGCAAAMIFAWSDDRITVRLPSNLLLTFGWVITAAIAFGVDHQNKLLAVVGYPIFSLLVGATLLRLALTPSTRFRRYLLENSCVSYLGRISYGIYLWQLPVIDGLRELAVPEAAVLVLAPALSILLASGSYFLVERPFLRLKARLSANRRAGADDRQLHRPDHEIAQSAALEHPPTR